MESGRSYTSMKQRIIAIRYLLGIIAVSIALSLVCFAQQTTGDVMPGPAKSAEKDPIANMVNDWTRAREYTKEYLDAMPEEGVNFKPNPDIRSFAEQMLHLATANFMFSSSAAGTASPYDPRQGKNLEKMD